EGFETREAEDGRDALAKLGVEKIAMCILDVMMPGMDGFEFCKAAQRYYPDMPILMLTAKSETASKVQGLMLGADDYLVKPFEQQEFIARVKALLRRYNAVSAMQIDVGRIMLDRDSLAVRDGEERFEIPMKEFELLFELGAAKGKTLSRDRLIEDIWGFDFDGNERTLDVHIGRLRERFPEEKYGFKIVTVRGLGYRLEEL
ncbi:MAG: response regulator transcription factor, partial [Clostridiales Family XIII bacterium]|nr:response regulator transcription factor [Clostridiales Family XIII bacterium]